MYVLGGIEDNVALLVWGNLFTKIHNYAFIRDLLSYPQYSVFFQGLLQPFHSNQPMFNLFLSFSLSKFGINFYNFMVVFSIFLAFLCAYLFFKKFKFAIFYSLIFAFSSYIWAHFGRHLDLMQIWLIPVFFYLVSKQELEKSIGKVSLLAGLYLTFSVLVSNYIGFFLILFYSFYSLVSFVRRSLIEHRFKIIHLKRALVSLAIFLSTTVPIMLPFIKENYFSNKKINNLGTVIVSRTLDDFVSFSSRPWYFFVPPTKNPILGSFSNKILDSLKSNNYFLNDDYFFGESSADYFGIVFLTTVLVFSVYVLRKAPPEIKSKIVVMWGTVILLLCLMMPPYFTISGHFIYTPGFLMYKLFPMFRVTERLGIIVLFCLLTILAYSTDYIFTLSDRFKKFLKIFIPLLTIITIFETYSPPKIYKVHDNLALYSYLNNISAPKSIFAVYPYSEVNNALFWLPVFQRDLINIRGYNTGGFESGRFTEQLVTPQGLVDFEDRGGKYIVLYKNASDEDKNFFLFNKNLVMLKEFNDSYLLSFRNIAK